MLTIGQSAYELADLRAKTYSAEYRLTAPLARWQKKFEDKIEAPLQPLLPQQQKSQHRTNLLLHQVDISNHRSDSQWGQS